MLAMICTMTATQSDRAFMLELYQQFFRLMFSTARKCHLKQDECEEVVQESLVKLIQKVSLIREMPKPVLASYIVSTTRNTAYDYTGRQTKQNAYAGSLDDESFSACLESDSPPLDNQMEASEQKAQLAAVLDAISRDDRILLEGRYILQYSDEVLSRMLHCKTSSIRMKLTRARRGASKLLGAEGNGVL